MKLLNKSTGISKGFTLPEMMVTMAIFGLVSAGIISTHLFGLRMCEITKAKLGASDDSRRALDKIVNEIRSASTVRVGDGSSGTFVEAALNAPQLGNAVEIYPTSATNSWIRYYVDSGDKQLKRKVSGSAALSVVAHFVTNSAAFTSEDAYGNVLTNNANNRVLGMSLEFYQMQYPMVKVGPGNFYDFYKLETKITRRRIR